MEVVAARVFLLDSTIQGFVPKIMFFFMSGKCPNWLEMIQNTEINKYTESAAKKVLNLF